YRINRPVATISPDFKTDAPVSEKPVSEKPVSEEPSPEAPAAPEDPASPAATPLDPPIQLNPPIQVPDQPKKPRKPKRKGKNKGKKSTPAPKANDDENSPAPAAPGSAFHDGSKGNNRDAFSLGSQLALATFLQDDAAPVEKAAPDSAPVEKAAPDSAPATTEEEKPQYNPLDDELRNTIRKSLSREPATQAIKERFNRLRDEIDELVLSISELDLDENGVVVADEIDESQQKLFQRLLTKGDTDDDGSLNKEEISEAIAREVTAAAKRACENQVGLTYHQTKEISAWNARDKARELAETYIGDNNAQSVRFVNYVFGNQGIDPYSPIEQSRNVAGDQFLFWTQQAKDARVPKFEDVRKNVAAAWRTRFVRALALAMAKKQAKSLQAWKREHKFPLIADFQQAWNEKKGGFDLISKTHSNKAKDGKADGAYSFNGIGDSLVVQDHDNLDDVADAKGFSVSLWIRPEELTPGPMVGVLSKETARKFQGAYALYINQSAGEHKIFVEIGGGGFNEALVSKTALKIKPKAAENWRHVVFVYRAAKMKEQPKPAETEPTEEKDGADDAGDEQPVEVVESPASLTLYIDGKLDAETEDVSLKMPNSPANLVFGRLGTPFGRSTPRSFKGLMDEARIYRVALSEKDVEQLYKSPAKKLDGKTLTARWNMDDADQFTIADATESHPGKRSIFAQPSGFSWLTRPGNFNSPPDLSRVPPIEAGHDFMRQVFSLDKGQFGAAFDQSHSTLYLLYVSEMARPDFNAFMKDMEQPPRSYAQTAETDVQEAVFAIHKRLEKEARIEWKQEASARNQ
ncbi:MAG: hypothetical protein N2C14_20735, partial [Planctomycetales bacterium]